MPGRHITPEGQLRPTQAAVLRAIEAYIQRHDRPPTLREIAQDADITSLAHVVFLLNTLEQGGYITREPGVSRGIHLTHLAHRTGIRRPSGVPILGTIAAGAPLDLYDPAEVETLDVGAHARTVAAAEFALRVRGDSMIEEGILDGDYVLVRPGHTAHEGALVVAVHLLAEGGSERGAATLKRLQFQADRRDGQVRRVLLCPANAALRPLAIPMAEWEREWQVQGTVTAVYRRFGR
jgi:repressor LexA